MSETLEVAASVDMLSDSLKKRVEEVVDRLFSMNDSAVLVRIIHDELRGKPRTRANGIAAARYAQDVLWAASLVAVDGRTALDEVFEDWP